MTDSKTLPSEVEREIERGSCWSFCPSLEEQYRSRCAWPIARFMGRASLLAGSLTLLGIGLDNSVSKDVLLATWPWRVAVAAFCILVSTFLFRSRYPRLAGVVYGSALLCMMAVIEYAGSFGTPLVQDRYSLAAIVGFAVALGCVPVPFPSALMVGAAGWMLYPLLSTVFGADTRSLGFDAIVGTAAIGTAVLLLRRRDVDRRRSFLDTLRYEFAATELSLMNQELLRLSNTDALTGLPNRRFFEAEAARLCNERGADSFGAIMIDIDNFKKFNDTAGHVAGDVCLRSVAQALSGSLPEDRGKIARYGGEEFVAIIPSTTPDQLERLCDELRVAVSRLGLPHPGFPGRNVSISAGLAWSSRVGPEGARPLLEDADRALYAAKAAGRDQFAWARLHPEVNSPSLAPEAGDPRPAAAPLGAAGR